MSQYIPSPPPIGGDIDTLKRWMASEMDRIALCSTQAGERMSLQILHVVPTKYANGDIFEADGTDWNPGSGAGTYIVRAGSFVKLG